MKKVLLSLLVGAGITVSAFSHADMIQYVPTDTTIQKIEIEQTDGTEPGPSYKCPPFCP